MFNATEFLGAGMTTLLAFAETTPQVQKASQAGVPWAIHIQPADSGMDDYFRGLVTAAAAYSGCEGWLVFDEPNRLQMPVAKAASDWIRTISPNTPVYACAFPYYATSAQLYGNASNPTYSWTTYLDDFISIIQPDILMYDDYPFLADGSTRSAFLSGVMEVRAKGIGANLPILGGKPELFPSQG